MRERALIYPSLQQPVPLTMVSGETITLDKWYPPLSTPPRFLARRQSVLAAQQQTFAYGPRYDFNPAASRAWAPPLNEPPKPKRSVLTGQQQAFAYTPRSGVFTAKDDIGWFRSLNEPPKRKVSIATGAQQSFAFVIPFEVYVNPMRWWRPLNEPPKPRVSVLTAAQQHFIYQQELPLPEVTLDEWYRPLSEPAAYLLPRRLVTGAQQHFAFGPRYDFDPAGTISWFRQLDEPSAHLKGRPRLLPGLQPSLMMVLHYPRLPAIFLEGYSYEIDLTGYSGSLHLEGYTGAVQGDLAVSSTAFSTTGVDSATYTFSGLSLGAEHPDRYIVVALAYRIFDLAAADLDHITSVTIAGIAADRLHMVVTASSPADSHTGIAFYGAKVPTGATGDVVMALQAAANRAGVQVWRIVGDVILFDTGSDATGNPYSDSVSVAKGGVALAAVYSVVLGVHSLTWTGVTEDNEGEIELESNMFSVGSATISTTETLAVTATDSDYNEDFPKAFGVISLVRRPSTVSLVGLDGRQVYLEGYKADSGLT